jgi:adenosylcobyric acid synthase
MHIGETSGPDASSRAFSRLANGQHDGAISADGRVVGTYVHGLFADDRQRARWLNLLGAETSDLAYEALVDDILDRFADHLEMHLDCERLLAISAR